MKFVLHVRNSHLILKSNANFAIEVDLRWFTLTTCAKFAFDIKINIWISPSRWRKWPDVDPSDLTLTIVTWRWRHTNERWRHAKTILWDVTCNIGFENDFVLWTWVCICGLFYVLRNVERFKELALASSASMQHGLFGYRLRFPSKTDAMIAFYDITLIYVNRC